MSLEKQIEGPADGMALLASLRMGMWACGSVALLAVIGCDEARRSGEGSPSSAVDKATTGDPDVGPRDVTTEELVDDEILVTGRKIVAKIEMYESEHGFLPTAATAMAIIPEGWFFARRDEREYTLTKDLDEGNGQVQYRHIAGDGDARHGAWYLLHQNAEVKLAE